MGKTTIRIGDAVYATKKAAKEAIRLILYSYPVGATVSDDHAEVLANLLELHPERDAKIGVGIRSFQVEQNQGSVGFWLTRMDGTRTDFSFLACLTPPTPEAEARAGFRSEIRPQVESFRATAFAGRTAVPCAVTNEIVVAACAHVDHNPTFDDLLRQFLGTVGLPLAEIRVEPTRDGETETRLADRALAERWSTFHRQTAKLRIVSKQANLSLLRRHV